MGWPAGWVVNYLLGLFLLQQALFFLLHYFQSIHFFHCLHTHFLFINKHIHNLKHNVGSLHVFFPSEIILLSFSPFLTMWGNKLPRYSWLLCPQFWLVAPSASQFMKAKPKICGLVRREWHKTAFNLSNCRMWILVLTWVVYFICFVFKHSLFYLPMPLPPLLPLSLHFPLSTVLLTEGKDSHGESTKSVTSHEGRIKPSPPHISRLIKVSFHNKWAPKCHFTHYE